MDVDSSSTCTRAVATFSPTGGRFLLRAGESYEQQYSHVYQKRLTKLKPVLLSADSAAGKAMAAAAAEGYAVCERIVKLRAGQKACVVGCMFKDMVLRPNPLKRLAAAAAPETVAAVGGAGGLAQYRSDDDTLILEDASGRVRLGGEAATKEFTDGLVTGIVVMVQGVCDDEGIFVVDKLCPAGFAPQPPRPAASGDASDAPLVLVLSGLGFGAGDDDAAAALPDGTGVGNALHLLTDFVCGHVGGPAEQRRAARIARVVIAGESVSRELAAESAGAKSAHHYTATGSLTKKQQRQLCEPMKQLDRFISELAATVPVDLMPGATDPANVMMPQQPLHRCLLPMSTALPGYRATTNPYSATIAGVDVLGHSGQPLHDMHRFSTASLEDCLTWRHIAPTAPNSLPCYPFSTHDPFVIESSPCVEYPPVLRHQQHAVRAAHPTTLPACSLTAHTPRVHISPSPLLLFAPRHVYFSGNAEAFRSHEAVEDGVAVRVIEVPRFCTTATAVLVNLQTLEAKPITFGTEL